MLNTCHNDYMLHFLKSFRIERRTIFFPLRSNPIIFVDKLKRDSSNDEQHSH